MRYIFISWAPNCSRSHNIARHFSGKSYMIYYSIFGSNYLSIVFKYFFQSIKSLTVLLRDRPDVIFVMNPPVFCCIPAWLYCKVLKRGGYITDSHTAAFRQLKWKRLFFLQKVFFTNSISNIVTNERHASIVRKWGADYTIIGDIPVRYANMRRYDTMKQGFNITLVNSFSDTEPVDTILKAAEEVKDINFYITGNLRHANRQIQSNVPKNVIFTDFLSDDQYAWLLKHSDAVMTQTTVDNTMQRGAYEAMAFETPIITSNWDILKKTFYKGALFFDNDVNSVIQTIYKMKKYHSKFKKEIKELKEERLAIWKNNKKVLESKIKDKLDSKRAITKNKKIRRRK